RTYSLGSNPDGSATRFQMTEEFSGLMLPLIGGRLPDFGAIFEQYASDVKAESEREVKREGPGVKNQGPGIQGRGECVRPPERPRQRRFMRGGRRWRRRWRHQPGRYDQEPGLHAGGDRYWSSEDGLRWALKQHLISWNIYVAEGQDLAPAFALP